MTFKFVRFFNIFLACQGGEVLNYRDLINEIMNNSQINKRWKSYCNITKYAEGLSFNDIIKTIKEIIEFLIK